MSIKFDTFKAGGGGVGTDNLDDVTTRGATTTNAITVGGVTIGTEYSLPAADGSSNQYLKTDGAGTLSFAALDVTGGLVYQGAFNATAGTPSIANAEKGDFYVIDTAGSLYGQDWNIGDHLLINEDMGGTITNSKIDKIDNTETPASETVAGVIEIATNLEAQGASVNNKALVPSNISSIALSSFNDDLSYLSSGDNVSLLTNDAGYLTSVPSASETVEGIIETATNVEAQGASVNNKALVPSNISSIALSSFNDDLSYLSSGDNVSLLTNDAGYLTGITGENLGDLSDVTITSVTNNQVLQYDSGSSAWINATISTGGLGSVVEDTAPQLGGDLDVNGKAITSASNGNVVINPNGTGDISIGADLIPDADATHTIGDENNRYISYYGDMNGAIRFKAKNNQGGQITKGQAVYISGVSGTVPEVKLAQANSSLTMPAFGLAYATANDQADIEIVTFGNLNDYNTTTYSLSANDTVYVSAATAGALTNSAPTSETNLIQNIGRVVRADASAGIIKVGGAGRSNATPNLNQNKIFLGNASNQAVSTALSSIALSSFNDDLSYLSSGDNISLLTNDSGYLTGITGENLGDLSDVTITSVTNNQVLQYDSGSSAWINATISTGGGSVPNLTSISSSQTTDYTISSTTGIEEIYIIDPGAAINVNLPAAATAGSGYKYNIKNISGTYSLTIDPNSTETIDGVSTYSLNVQYQSVTIVSDGSNWFII
jgi:muramidase (phage lysozyme)